MPHAPTCFGRLLLLLAGSFSFVTACTQPTVLDGAAPGSVADGGLLRADGASGPALPPGAAAPTVVATVPADLATGVARSAEVRIELSQPMDAASTLVSVHFVPAVACTATVDGAVFTCAHAPLEPSTLYTVTMQAGARDGAGVALEKDYVFTFTTAAAVIDTVALAGSSTREVRQGAGEITLTATGSGLAGITQAMLGTLPTTVVSNGDAQAIVKASVPHGQKPGALALTFMAPTGAVVAPAAIIVTEISAAAGHGDDAGAGTASAPFSTLARALVVAATGDTVKLSDGTYSVGEAWAHGTPNVPPGVTILGSSLAGTVLTPQGGSPTDATALHFAGEAVVSHLSVHGFARGALANGAGYVSFDTVRIWGNVGDGITLSGAAASLSQALEVDTNGGAGVRVESGAFFSAYGGKLHDNATGVHVAGTSSMVLTAMSVTHNGSSATKTDAGIFLTDHASAKISGDVSENAGPGIYSESSAFLQVEGTVNHNGTAADCNGHLVCSGIVTTAGGPLSSQAHLTHNAMYGLLSLGKHTTIELTGATLSDNGYANAAFSDTDATFGSTVVTIKDTQLSNSPTGIGWGDHVQVTMTGGSMSAHSMVDLSNGASAQGWDCRFTDVRLGLKQIYYPARPGTVIVSTASNPSGGPTWTISYPSTSGGSGRITFTN